MGKQILWCRISISWMWLCIVMHSQLSWSCALWTRGALEWATRGLTWARDINSALQRPWYLYTTYDHLCWFLLHFAVSHNKRACERQHSRSSAKHVRKPCNSTSVRYNSENWSFLSTSSVVPLTTALICLGEAYLSVCTPPPVTVITVTCCFETLWQPSNGSFWLLAVGEAGTSLPGWRDKRNCVTNFYHCTGGCRSKHRMLSYQIEIFTTG